MCPNDEWPAARPSKVSPFYDRLGKANAVFGENYGLEVPLWFAPEDSAPVETPSFHRSNSHAPVGEECRAVRDSLGILDGCSFGKYEVFGPAAEEYLDYVFASRLPAIGRVRMGPLLSPSGHMKGDLTVMRLAEQRFLVFGSGYLQEFHMLWFEQQRGDRDVQIVNRIQFMHVSQHNTLETVEYVSFTAAKLPEISTSCARFASVRQQLHN